MIIYNIYIFNYRDKGFESVSIFVSFFFSSLDIDINIYIFFSSIESFAEEACIKFIDHNELESRVKEGCRDLRMRGRRRRMGEGRREVGKGSQSKGVSSVAL